MFTNSCSVISREHHENTRLLSARLQPLHFWAPGPCQISIKALEREPGNPVPAPKCRWHHSEKRRGCSEEWGHCHIALFLLSPGCWVSPTHLVAGSSPLKLSSMCRWAPRGADGSQQRAGSRGIPLCEAAGSTWLVSVSLSFCLELSEPVKHRAASVLLK